MITPRTLEILDRLIRFNTVSHYSNLPVVDWIAAHLAGCGFSVTRLPDKDRRKQGILASLGPGDGAGILLSGHTDVVPVEGQAWSRDPFRLTQADGRAYGRGTTDMKGFLACALALAERASRVRLRKPLGLILSYDEEVGCIGIPRMLDQPGARLGQPRVCIVGEPTEMQVAIGHKGKTALRVVCHGASGHSALAPQFVNALHLAVDFVAAMRRLQHSLECHGPHDHAHNPPFTTIHVGRLQGGTALNVVPDQAEIDLEFRNLITDDSHALAGRITATAYRVAEAYRNLSPEARVEARHILSYPGFEIASGDAAVLLAHDLVQSNGACVKLPFGTEAGYFARQGIPTIVCGPGSMAGQGHKPDEYVELAQLAACDAMMSRVLELLVA